jgi:superfamily II DNA/RNA helicase
MYSPLQREVIVAAVEGHDVFLQAATSFGKSLCFQLPAVNVSHGGMSFKDLSRLRASADFAYSNACCVSPHSIDG